MYSIDLNPFRYCDSPLSRHDAGTTSGHAGNRNELRCLFPPLPRYSTLYSVTNTSYDQLILTRTIDKGSIESTRDSG